MFSEGKKMMVRKENTVLALQSLESLGKETDTKGG